MRNEFRPSLESLGKTNTRKKIRQIVKKKHHLTGNQMVLFSSIPQRGTRVR